MGEMYALLMFPAGFLGNFVCQTTRALGNFALSSISLSLATMQMTLGALMILGGGRDKGRACCSRAWKRAKGATRRLVVGTAQGLGAATFATPLLRGAQASSERFAMQGLYSPSAPGTTHIQSVFGLNSWNTDTEQPKKEIRSATTRPARNKVKAPAARTKNRIPKNEAIFATDQTKTLAAEAKREKVAPPEWSALVSQYLASRTSRDMETVRRRMATKHPLLYLRALKTVQKSGKRQGSRI